MWSLILVHFSPLTFRGCENGFTLKWAPFSEENVNVHEWMNDWRALDWATADVSKYSSTYAWPGAELTICIRGGLPAIAIVLHNKSNSADFEVLIPLCAAIYCRIEVLRKRCDYLRVELNVLFSCIEGVSLSLYLDTQPRSAIYPYKWFNWLSSAVQSDAL